MNDMLNRLHPVLFAGTGSDVGKSVIAAAFCRIFRQDGYSPAPFKAQNMALNSYVTPDGREIGRAQAVQAEAAGIPCHTEMNPVLLKPLTDTICQIILHGRPIGNHPASELFTPGPLRNHLQEEAYGAYDRLACRCNPIVLEGAGSISELNLRDRDFVNMPMALHAGADVILIADIDRGGIFASLYGTMQLLPPEERSLVKGILINKFRGDSALFESGRRQIETLCGIPVLGVIPYFRDLQIEAEDSLVRCSGNPDTSGQIRVCVVLLRHLSNFTDFNALERDPRFRLLYTADPEELKQADIIILPGSKSVLSDLSDLRRTGMAQCILDAAQRGKTVVGICGGYQMMGVVIRDPQHLEGPTEIMPGLGLLPVETTLEEEKITRRVKFTLCGDTRPCEGYEIHMGRTVSVAGTRSNPLAVHEDGTPDGCFGTPNCMGTYLHGIADNEPFVELLLKRFGNTPAAAPATTYRQFKEEQYNKLAALVRAHTDMDRLYAILSA